MPVSTFSSANSARQHSAMIARWNSTRDRINADDRRRRHVDGAGSMQELDGTGLYERPDWPLASPPSREGQGKRESGKSGPTQEQPVVDDNAVMRKSEEIGGWVDGHRAFVEEPDVSDIEEEEDDDDDVAGETQAKWDSDVPSEAASSLPSRQLSVDDITRTRTDDLLRARSTVPKATFAQDVSPSRSSVSPESVVGVGAGHEEQEEKEAEEEHDEEEEEEEEEEDDDDDDDDDDDNDDEQDAQEEEERPAGDNITANKPTGSTSMAQHEGVSPRSMPRVRDEEVSDEDLDEMRDVATAIPFAGESPNLRQGSVPSIPQLNGTVTPTTNGHAYRSSIAKSPLITPHRRTPTASSMHSTTQLPANRDRVRYSWQSLQDDEPNRPRIHIIKLISNTATASAGFPQGEAFGFSISPGGKRIAAYNSARLYVLQTAALPVGISQDYALRRRPSAVEITDEANVMAILADDHTINIYELGLQGLQRTRTLTLDFPTTCIALAPTGGLLAAAYEGGVEIFSLDPNALPTDRRAVRSPKMDRMAFSDDGATLLGTTVRINVSSTVVVSVPVFPSAPDGIPTHEELKEAWCSELLHPENIRNSSHATFMRENRSTGNDRFFAWNGLADTFGILNSSDLEYGNVDFPIVISPPLSTCGGLGAAIHSCPTIDEHGETVAMIVNDRTIRLYLVPRKVEDDETPVEAHSIDHELDEGYGCPFSEVRWVYNSASAPAPWATQPSVRGRLIVTSPGGVVEGGNAEEMLDDIEGGRIIMFDFDPQFAGQPGQTFNLTLGKSPPQLLEEEPVSVADQVSLVRRRTVNQSKGGGLSQRPIHLGRAAATFGAAKSTKVSGLGLPAPADPYPSRASMLSIGSTQTDASRSLPDLLEGGERLEAAIEEPYAQNAPRSYASLQRAASNAQRHRFQTLEERTRERASVDSNGAMLPLPEYTEEPNAPLPSRYRAMAGLDAPTIFQPPKPGIATGSRGANSPGGVTSYGSVTAPPDVGAHFSADEAFRRANANLITARQTITEQAREEESIMPPTSASPISALPRTDTFASESRMSPAHPRTGRLSGADSPDGSSLIGRTGPFDSLASMPRGLQRAYSNAMSTPGQRVPPGVAGGDWRHVASHHTSPSPTGGAYGTGPTSTTPASSIRGGDDSRDVDSPVSSRFGRPTSPYRHSTSSYIDSSNPTGPHPPSASSSTAFPPNYPSTGGRRMPPHMQAFRNAAAAASLFPPTQSRDHVPFRQPPVRAGAVAHPITAWHPPAPSSPPPPPLSSSSLPGPAAAAASSSSSVAGRSAAGSTATTQRARKRRGVFGKRRAVPDPYAPSRGRGDDGSLLETKSMVTWMTRGEGKCAVM